MAKYVLIVSDQADKRGDTVYGPVSTEEEAWTLKEQAARDYHEGVELEEGETLEDLVQDLMGDPGGWDLGFSVGTLRAPTPPQSRCRSCDKPYVDHKLSPQLPHAIPGMCCECAGKSFDASWEECIPWPTLAELTLDKLKRSGMEGSLAHFELEQGYLEASTEDDDGPIMSKLEDIAASGILERYGDEGKELQSVLARCLANANGEARADA